MNNYLGQIALTHVYAIAFIPFVLRKKLKANDIIKRGWMIGLCGIILGLIIEKYYSRIPDYSFPLMFMLFAVYWVKHKRFRKLVVIGTFALLVVSQLMIFNDPFSMRRYYEQNEIDSAKRIINLWTKGTAASDLRTAALFRHLGRKGVIFDERLELELHNSMFYEYENANLSVDYIILAKAMRSIVYAANFETYPLDDEIFDYYSANFRKVYDDHIFMVYRIK
jgi:hypothetical protein